MKTFRIKSKEQQKRENLSYCYPSYCEPGMDEFAGNIFYEGHPSFLSYDEYCKTAQLKDKWGSTWWIASELIEEVAVVQAAVVLGNQPLMAPSIGSISSSSTSADEVADKVLQRLGAFFRDNPTHDQSSKEVGNEECFKEPWLSGKPNEDDDSYKKPDEIPSHTLPKLKDDTIKFEVKDKYAIDLRPLPSKKNDKPIKLKNIE